MSDEIKEILDKAKEISDYGADGKQHTRMFNQFEAKALLDYITNLQTIEREYSNLLSENAELQQEKDRLNNIIKNLDKIFEYYFLGNLKYDQDTVNTIYIKYVKLKELKENNNEFK